MSQETQFFSSKAIKGQVRPMNMVILRIEAVFNQPVLVLLFESKGSIWAIIIQIC